jgi:hypothetical protein
VANINWREYEILVRRVIRLPVKVHFDIASPLANEALEDRLTYG